MTKTFILGNPRSGTSLLRLMLQQHDVIVAPPEGGFAHWLLSKYENWNVRDGENTDKIKAYVIDVLACRKMETWKMDQTMLTEFIMERKPSSYAILTSLVYEAYKHHAPVRAIVDKNNYYITHLEQLNRIWPNAQFIHMVRDGRDVACSYLELQNLTTSSPYQPRLSNKLAVIGNEWNTNNRGIVDFLEKQKSLFTTIKYEDLVMTPEKVLTKICDFIQVPYDPKMIEYHKNEDEKYKEPTATLDWKLKTRMTLDTSRLGRYEEDLTAKQLSVFTAVAKEMLTFFHYD